MARLIGFSDHQLNGVAQWMRKHGVTCEEQAVHYLIAVGLNAEKNAPMNPVGCAQTKRKMLRQVRKPNPTVREDYTPRGQWTRSQIREARELREHVVEQLNGLAVKGGKLHLHWFSNRELTRKQYDGLLDECLRNPERDRWDRGIAWLTLAGSTKARGLYMHSTTLALGQSPKHGKVKLLCAADGDSGYELKVGQRGDLRSVLARNLPNHWYGVDVDRKPTHPECVKFLDALKRDAPGQIERLKRTILKAIAKGDALGMDRRVVHRAMIVDWETGRAFGGLLAPLVNQVFRYAPANKQPKMQAECRV